MMVKKTVCIKLSEPIIKQIKDYSDKNGINMSQTITKGILILLNNDQHSEIMKTLKTIIKAIPVKKKIGPIKFIPLDDDEEF